MATWCHGWGTRWAGAPPALRSCARYRDVVAAVGTGTPNSLAQSGGVGEAWPQGNGGLSCGAVTWGGGRSPASPLLCPCPALSPHPRDLPGRGDDPEPPGGIQHLTDRTGLPSWGRWLFPWEEHPGGPSTGLGGPRWTPSPPWDSSAPEEAGAGRGSGSGSCGDMCRTGRPAAGALP